ncbi:MAG: portal protein [Novosphingobium sp.]|uniref:portal protein n=1 Tax=Novosphingobium sp. TaxID=1874826 RepID=UPI003016CAA1
MTDAEIIAEARERLELCINADDGDRSLALEDLKFKKGDQWDEQSVRQRELDSRPCLTINNIPAIIHQVVNDVRQNEQSIHVHPVGDGADEEVAEVIEGLIRHIEYDSCADTAYDTALDSAASIGFGFFRLVTEYCNDTSFEQEMKIKRVRNPFTIYLDPSSQEPDGSDAEFGFVTSKEPKKEFERLYPNKDPSYDYIAKGTGDDENWLGEDFVRICEYYRFEYETATLVEFSDGLGRVKGKFTVQDIPPGVAPTGRSRQTTLRKVMWYKLTAREVLEKAEVPFKWIPLFPVYGDEIDLDGKVTRFGIIRNAKDPKKMENYWMTAATEEIALRTKVPYIGAMGQFEGVEDDWQSANVKSFSYLEYNPVTIDGTQAPPPQRQPPADVPSGFIAMAGMMRDSVKAVTGIYDASLGNRSNETSGIAIRARQHQGDVGNYHFSGNLARTIRHLGRVIISGIPYVYDTQRVLRAMGKDGQASQVEINKPEEGVDEYGNAVQRVLNDLTIGEYGVVVSSGPAYNTLKQEAAESMVQMSQSWPKLMEVAGDKVVRAMDWPGADDIADRIAKTLPPGLADEDKKQKDAPPMVQTPNGPIPLDQAGQMIGQMDEALSRMNDELEKHEAGIKKAEIAAAASIEVARINAEAKGDNAELSAFAKLLMMRAQPEIDHSAAVQAAADPMHPNAPAPIAQGLEQPPADAQAMEQQQAMQPDPASAPEGAEA